MDTLGDLVIYTKSKREFLSKELGIKDIPSKAMFVRVLSIVDGKKIGDVVNIKSFLNPAN